MLRYATASFILFRADVLLQYTYRSSFISRRLTRLLVDFTEITTLVTLHISLTLILSNALYSVFFCRSRLFFPKCDLLCDLVYFNHSISTRFVFLRFVYLLRNNNWFKLHHCVFRRECVLSVYIFFVVIFTISFIFLYSPSTQSVEA